MSYYPPGISSSDWISRRSFPLPKQINGSLKRLMLCCRAGTGSIYLSVCLSVCLSVYIYVTYWVRGGAAGCGAPVSLCVCVYYILGTWRGCRLLSTWTQTQFWRMSMSRPSLKTIGITGTSCTSFCRCEKVKIKNRDKLHELLQMYYSVKRDLVHCQKISSTVSKRPTALS